MNKIWMYSIAASKDPDRIHCVVPWRVNESLIFFGPCKKRIREKLRSQYLRNGVTHATVSDPLYIVGVNGGNTNRIRKVVWWGRVSEVMTFCEASKRLRGSRFIKMLEEECSPLHVRPIYDAGENLVGYQHVSKEHAEDDAWIADLVSSARRKHTVHSGNTIRLRNGSAWEVFDRDCCLLLENRFFVEDDGIALDDTAVQILRDRQTDVAAAEIDNYAIFGMTRPGGRPPQAKGLRGTFLNMEGAIADRFLAWLESKAGKSGSTVRAGNHGITKTRCS